MNRFFLFVLLLTLSTGSFSQNRKDTVPASENLKVVSRYRNGAVELRWYPASAADWRKANKVGYLVKRMELSDAGSAAGYKELALIKPYTDAEWKQRTNVQDTFVKTTIQSMAPIDTKSLIDRDNEENMAFFTYVLSTSFSVEAAKGAGLMYTDKTIEAGKKYVYSVSINNTKKTDPNDEVLTFVANTETNYVAPSPEGLIFEEGEGIVKLSWDNNTDLFSSYYIERSADGGRTFNRLNKIPFITVAQNANHLEFTDSVKNYVPYQYRIVGLTPWVDRSTPSVVVKAMGRDKTGASPPLNVRAKGDRSKILVTWEVPVVSKDLKGFIVGRASKLEGPFNPISDRDKLITNGLRMFSDNKPSPQEPYYAVYAVDTANNLSTSFSVMASVYDSIGPSKPMAVRGTIDSTGIVKLSWKFGNDIDLVGYQVYTANGKENIFRQITGSALIDSVFTDTVSMRSLTEEVYYKVTAVDYNNNPSEYSDLVVLKRPDVVAPALPVISDYSINNNKITLTMLPSSSDDVVKYQLIRLDDGGAKTTLAEMRQMTNSFTDTTAKEGMNYSYMLVATDDAGLTSSSKPLRISVQEQEMKEGVASLTARLEEREKKVMLQWNPPASAGYTLVLFRSVNDAEMEWYKKLSTGSQTFAEALDAGKYQYAIKVLYNNGAESALSRPVSVEVK